MRLGVIRYYPDARAVAIDKDVAGSNDNFRIVAKEFGKEIILGRAGNRKLAWRNAYNQMNN